MKKQIRKKIALFGGSFDPPHRAHFDLLEQVQSQFHFSKIWIIPSKYPPGKNPVADYDKRLEWATKTFSNGVYEISNFEENSSHTIFAKDIIPQLQLQAPEPEYYWILGEDQWEQLPYWKDVDHYASNLQWVVLKRDMQNSALGSGIYSRRLPASTCSYYWAQTTQMPEISSTVIRNKISYKDFSLQDFKKLGWLPKSIQDDVWTYYRKLNE